VATSVIGGRATGFLLYIGHFMSFRGQLSNLQYLDLMVTKKKEKQRTCCNIYLDYSALLA
jgi:hypothetical protein